ncbi:MAG: ImmA/IrrE family metallo-endopeptidase [Elusimicrobia bacterium]|nr:ImmA/IrrE family metallo-endopeptidase [Elusimicrobiota bacterium]
MSIKLSNKRCEEIKRIVVDMFVKYNVNCIPVNGFEIATKMGIKVLPYSSIKKSKRFLLYKPSKDGFFIEKEKDKFYIFYNDEKGYGRINYTILHEIGHIVLGHLQDSELAEKEVNFFAKYALVPPVLVHKLKLDNPTDISRIFDVSYEEAKYAYSYYQKWLIYGSDFYTDYEFKILELFKLNVA